MEWSVVGEIKAISFFNEILNRVFCISDSHIIHACMTGPYIKCVILTVLDMTRYIMGRYSMIELVDLLTHFT